LLLERLQRIAVELEAECQGTFHLRGPRCLPLVQVPEPEGDHGQIKSNEKPISGVEGQQAKPDNQEAGCNAKRVVRTSVTSSLLFLTEKVERSKAPDAHLALA
jgi:hypothetical protein